MGPAIRTDPIMIPPGDVASRVWRRGDLPIALAV